MTDPNDIITGPEVADRRAVRQRARVQKSRRQAGLVIFGSILGAVLLLGAAEGLATAGRIHPGVDVAGIDVGGMTRSRAVEVLEREHAKRAARPVVVVHDGKRFSVTGPQLELRFNAPAEAEKAFSVGRTRNLGSSLTQRISAWTGRARMEPIAEADAARLDDFLDKIAKVTDNPPVDAKVVIEDMEVTALDGMDGRRLQRDIASRSVLRAFAGPVRRPITAPVAVAVKRVDFEAAKQAAAVTKTMIARPVAIRYEKQKWSFEPADIAEWIDYRTVEATAMAQSGIVLEPFVSPKKASKPVTRRLGTKVGRPAKDASFKTNDGRVSIIPSKDGIGPDIESLSLSLTEELKDSSADRAVELRTSREEPELTTAEAKKMGIRERISVYTTTYGASNRPRVNNIHTLGDALNGTLIKPGGVFSFNEAAGERTAERGYQEAAAIVNGKLVPQLGGGVCQVGTTVFNAVFESGLPVIERRNHSFYIDHYPTGRDATVSWGGPDLKFKNDTEHWVLVSVSYTAGSISVALYGTDPGYEVEAEVGEWTDVRPYGIEKVKDPTLEVGMNYVEDPGVKGRSITVKRIVSKSGKVVRTDTFVSNYRPKAEIVKVGAKKGSAETSRTP